VATENSVRSENKEVPIIREIMVATTMSSLFVALFALVASSFRTVRDCRRLIASLLSVLVGQDSLAMFAQQLRAVTFPQLAAPSLAPNH